MADGTVAQDLLRLEEAIRVNAESTTEHLIILRDLLTAMNRRYDANISDGVPYQNPGNGFVFPRIQTSSFDLRIQQHKTLMMADNPISALFKLRQNSTVDVYRREFAANSQRIPGLSDQFLLICFIHGLRADLREDIQLFGPVTLASAMHLAHLQEENLISWRQYHHSEISIPNIAKESVESPLLISAIATDVDEFEMMPHGIGVVTCEKNSRVYQPNAAAIERVFAAVELMLGVQCTAQLAPDATVAAGELIADLLSDTVIETMPLSQIVELDHVASALINEPEIVEEGGALKNKLDVARVIGLPKELGMGSPTDDSKLDVAFAIGGVTSHSNAAQLAETIAAAKCPTTVVGVSVTLNGDLMNQLVETHVVFDLICQVHSQLINNVCTDALSTEKYYYYFIQLMGRKASHVAIPTAGSIPQGWQIGLHIYCFMLAMFGAVWDPGGGSCTCWNVSHVHEAWVADEDRVRKTVGLLERSIVQFSKAQELTCRFCFETYPLHQVSSTTCGHPFCIICSRAYVSTPISGGPGCLLLRCPNPSCGAAIGPDVIDQLVSNADQEKYSHYRLRSYIADSRKNTWCPALGCEYAVEFVVGSVAYDVSCFCSCGFCGNCTEAAHRLVDGGTVAIWLLKHSADVQLYGPSTLATAMRLVDLQDMNLESWATQSHQSEVLIPIVATDGALTVQSQAINSVNGVATLTEEQPTVSTIGKEVALTSLLQGEGRTWVTLLPIYLIPSFSFLRISLVVFELIVVQGLVRLDYVVCACLGRSWDPGGITMSMTHQYSRVPVYEQRVDNLVGNAYAMVLLAYVKKGKELESFIVGDMAHLPAYFVPDSMSVWNLLREFRIRKVHMAVVLNEYGGTVGLVTLEHVVAEIVGDIFDANNSTEEIQKNNTGYIVMRAVEYFLKGTCPSHPEIVKVLEFFHFACTSADITNLVHALIVEMFPIFFKAIRDSHPENVFSSMETIPTLVLEESANISSDLILHKIWHSNMPHNKIADRKGHQGWMKEEGPYFIFPGGGTMFPDGAVQYIEKLKQYIPIVGGVLRIALDMGCGVASFGGYLLAEQILTLSFAPRDSHKAQIQFALERGVPALVAMLGTRSLPFPAFSFDLVHCS